MRNFTTYCAAVQIPPSIAKGWLADLQNLNRG
jgi:hypothetical protein